MSIATNLPSTAQDDSAAFDLDFDPQADKIREECGIFGIFGIDNASSLTALGLHALQHRGQEACGIASYDGEKFHTERHLGLVGDNFTGDDPSLRRAALPLPIMATLPMLSPFVSSLLKTARYSKAPRTRKFSFTSLRVRAAASLSTVLSMHCARLTEAMPLWG